MCQKLTGIDHKGCIVNTFEKDLISAYNHNEVDAFFPSRVPGNWSHPFTSQNMGPAKPEQWIEGKGYARQLMKKDFPMKKQGKLMDIKGECTNMLRDDWLKTLAFPSEDIIESFTEEQRLAFHSLLIKLPTL